MQPPILQEKLDRKFSWKKTWRDVIYFGIPILVAILSVLLPIRTFLRQAMVGLIIVWFVIGSWLLNAPKE
jgi:hypothetical protein